MSQIYERIVYRRERRHERRVQEMVMMGQIPPQPAHQQVPQERQQDLPHPLPAFRYEKVQALSSSSASSSSSAAAAAAAATATTGKDRERFNGEDIGLPDQGESTIGVGDDAVQDVCCVCLDDFSNGDLVRILPCPCHGIFHCVCIDVWLRRSRLCPLCKTDLTRGVSNTGEGGGEGAPKYENRQVGGSGGDEPGDFTA